MGERGEGRRGERGGDTKPEFGLMMATLLEDRNIFVGGSGENAVAMVMLKLPFNCMK